MDMRSREQYLESVRQEYRRADRKQKSKLLNEARKRTHLNRKVLIRKLAHPAKASGMQRSPCWLALVGPFLFSTNSPSMSISRYAVYGQKIVQRAEVAATLNGSPTDIASGRDW